MKQHITKKQWNEVNEEKKWFLLKKMYGIEKKDEEKLCKLSPIKSRMSVLEQTERSIFGFGEMWRPPNIGQMIEFLGDDLERFDKGNSNGKVAYALKTKDRKQITAFELCDLLWEAVKYKVKTI